MRASGDRRDALENRSKLVDAVGRLLDSQGSVTLSQIAVEAGVSRATTYRNFQTADAAILAYVAAFLDEFEQAADATDSLMEVCSAWGQLVADRGHALVNVRSTEGFLARVQRDDEVITRIDRVVRRALRADPQLHISETELDLAVFVWNALLDPRELLDLAEHTDTSLDHAVETMTAIAYASLRSISN